jgi:hypothetical protein
MPHRWRHCTASSPPLDLPDLDVNAMADSNTFKSAGEFSLSLYSLMFMIGSMCYQSNREDITH